eukprot:6531028-Pyramimonas_sp.AAC.1
MVGLRVETVRRFCPSAASITAGLGTERIVVSTADIARGLHRHVGMALPRDTPPKGDQLLSRAVPCPGWNHIIDGALQTCLNTAKWPPIFFDRLKGGRARRPHLNSPKQH